MIGTARAYSSENLQARAEGVLSKCTVLRASSTATSPPGTKRSPRAGERWCEVFAEDATYTDPLAAVSGGDGIDQFIGAAQAQFAGMQFSLAGPVDAHHDQARFTWHLGAPGNQDPFVIGFDVAILDNGRIRSVYGFLDKVPALT